MLEQLELINPVKICDLARQLVREAPIILQIDKMNK